MSNNNSIQQQNIDSRSSNNCVNVDTRDLTIPKQNRKSLIYKINLSLCQDQRQLSEKPSSIKLDQSQSFHYISYTQTGEQSNFTVDEIIFNQPDQEKTDIINLIENSFSLIENKQQYQKYEQFIDQILQSLKQKNYKLTKYLNSGGQGDIFLGQQRISNQTEAQEYVFKFYFDMPADQLQEEVNIMKSFEGNINIIKLIDEIKVNDHIYILVLEKCEKSLFQELKEIYDQNIEFSTQQLLQIIFDLLDGLIQLRIYNILHLDIKPANILKTEKGEYVYTDFGCSQQIKQDRQIQSKGFSLQFASHEQLNNQISQINYQSDIQCLGKTLNYVIKVFVKANKIKIEIENKYPPYLKEIITIIQDHMNQNKIEDRKDIKEIHKLFFNLLINPEFKISSFLNHYQQKIKRQKDLFTFDVHKDTKYFWKIQLYYSDTDLTILKSLFPNLNNNFESISENKDSKEYNQQVGDSMIFLAVCYQNVGDLQNALKYAKESLEMFKQLYERNHSSISSSLLLLGYCFKDLGDLQNALKYANESLKMDEQLYEGNHPSISSSLFLLGQCFKDLGQLQNGLKYAKESLEMDKQLYKGNHKLISSSLCLVGKCYQDLGDSSNGLKYAKESLEMNIQLYEGNHPQKSYTLYLLGLCYKDLGDSQNALKYTKESLEMKRKLYEGNHQQIIYCLIFLGFCFNDLGDSQNALKTAKESHEMCKQLYTGNHPYTSISLVLLGFCLKDLGNQQDALKYAKESLEMIQKLYSGNHPSTTYSFYLLGQCFKDLGDQQNAFKYAKECLEMCIQLYEGNHPSISLSLQLLGQCYLDQLDSQNALKCAKESHEMCQQLYKGNHPQISSSLQLLGKCFKNKGDQQKALKYVNQSLEMYKQLYTGNHPSISSSLQLLGNYYKDLRDWQIALFYAQESLEMFQNLYKENHPSILSSQAFLRECQKENGYTLNF